VKAPDAGRLHAWLADPRVVDVDPPTVRRLRDRLAAGTDEAPILNIERHGTVIVRDPPRRGMAPRRILELDRGGTVLTALRWTDDGRLARAWIRVADESWVMIEPRATREAPWGLSDRLWHAAHPSAADPVPLTIFESLSYERIDRIPTLAEPARLPPAAGTAVLNLIAALAADDGRSRLLYPGPYPTEQLFLTLLESFRYHTDEADVLAAFLGGRLEWRPAPHERVCPGAGLMAHLRERVENVVWRGRVYHRPDRQGVQRYAARRVRDVDGAVVCSLWALGELIEDHLRLDPEATTVEVIAPPTCDTAPSRVSPAVMVGVASAAAALGATPLAPFVREVGAGCELVWAPVDRDLVAVDGTRLRVSPALRDLLIRRLRAADTRAQRLALGLAVVTELAHLFGDVLRARAQARVATLPPDLQARLLADTEAPADGTDDARRITEAVETLIADSLQ
jgi:hypothetical protein